MSVIFYEFAETSVPLSVPAVTNMPPSMFPGAVPSIAPPLVPPMPLGLPRTTPGPAVTHVASPRLAEPELSPDDQQQAQLLMQVWFIRITLHISCQSVELEVVMQFRTQVWLGMKSISQTEVF